MSFWKRIFIRDSAGNDRGANVTVSNELNVLESNSGGIKTGTDKIPASPATEGKQDDNITQNTATNTRLGEVQASPTANTVLDRLKSLFTRQGDGNQLTQIVDPDDATRKAALDSIVKNLIVMQEPHSHIHGGESYLVQEGIQLNNASKEYLIVTPNTTKWAHMAIAIEGGQDTLVSLVEATERTGGTAMAEINRNRNSGNTAGVVVTHTPGGSAGSPTTIFTCQWGIPASGGGRGGAGGTLQGRQEIILKQNTSYLLTVTALSANDNNICVVIAWYEHTNV